MSKSADVINMIDSILTSHKTMQSGATKNNDQVFKVVKDSRCTKRNDRKKQKISSKENLKHKIEELKNKINDMEKESKKEETEQIVEKSVKRRGRKNTSEPKNKKLVDANNKKLKFNRIKFTEIEKDNKFEVYKDLGKGWKRVFAIVYKVCLNNYDDINKQRKIRLRDKLCYGAYFIDSSMYIPCPEINPPVIGFGNTKLDAVKNLFSEYQNMKEVIWKDKTDILVN